MKGFGGWKQDDGNLLRFEYDNPVFQFYKHQYQEMQIRMTAMEFGVQELELAADGEIPEYPPAVKTLKARIYKHIGQSSGIKDD